MSEKLYTIKYRSESGNIMLADFYAIDGSDALRQLAAIESDFAIISIEIKK